MSTINNALLASGALKAQPHAVLVASVADGAEEIERLVKALRSCRAGIRYMNRYLEERGSGTALSMSVAREHLMLAEKVAVAALEAVK